MFTRGVRGVLGYIGRFLPGRLGLRYGWRAGEAGRACSASRCRRDTRRFPATSGNLPFPGGRLIGAGAGTSLGAG